MSHETCSNEIMTKQITGSCFNISIYRTASDVELLSVMIKDKDFKFWKFNLGEWRKFIKDYDEIIQLMTQTVTIEVEENCQSGGGYHPAKLVKQIIVD